jgi:long-chain acyl-CoA synthetase
VESLNYAQLLRAVQDFARCLQALGIQPGDRVAFLGTPGLPFWVCLLGSMRAGAVWLGLNPQYTERELLHVLRDAMPRLCLVGSSATAVAHKALKSACAAGGLSPPVAYCEGVAGLLDTLSKLRHMAPTMDMASAAMAADGVCLIVYTSGSTGSPKGALLSGRNLVENGWWLARRMGFAPQRSLVNLPVNHIGCVGDVCATLLVAGGTLIFMDRFDPVRAVSCVSERGITWLAQVPAQFQLMVGKGSLGPTDLRTVQHLLWGGAAMPEPLVRQLVAWVPDVMNGYGLTECSGTITVTECGASVAALAGSVGRAVDPNCLRIAGADGEPVAPGASGEIQIRGDHVFRGYLNQPDATREAFTSDGWLRTGDLARVGDDGNISLLGRTREMFKSGGYNIYPREVEAVIEGMAGVELCAVIGIADPLWSEVGLAFVQADPAVVTPERLLQHCVTQLARYKCPKRFVVRPQLPLLAMGKVDKQRLLADESEVP